MDTRAREEFAKGHVKGALSLPAPEIEERFSVVQSLLPQDSQIVLYCAGPGCDMAEKAASFVVQRGYMHLLVMNTGFRAWQKASYPVEGDRK